MNILRIIKKVLVEVVSLKSLKMNITKRPGNIVFVISYIILLIGFIVFFFCNYVVRQKKLSNNTYGSLGLRIASLNDCFGKSIKTDTLFINLYDYWTNFHDKNKKSYFWHSHLMWKLEMCIRKKWSKDLPNMNIVFDKYKKGDSFFDPRRFLDEFNTEKYFERLKDWKEKCEIYHLREKRHLKFGPYRHRKILGKAKTIRG